MGSDLSGGFVSRLTVLFILTDVAFAVIINFLAFFSVYSAWIRLFEEIGFLVVVVVVPEIKLEQFLAVYFWEVSVSATIEALKSKHKHGYILTFACIKSGNIHPGD